MQQCRLSLRGVVVVVERDRRCLDMRIGALLAVEERVAGAIVFLSCDRFFFFCPLTYYRTNLVISSRTTPLNQ